MSKRIFVLAHETARRRCMDAVWDAPDGHRVTLATPTRTSDQNSKFHAIVSDIAKSEHEWFGKPRNAAEWKTLMVSGHAVATKESSEIVPGLEGELVSLRESTALMSKRRGASLIEYVHAYCAMNGIKTNEVA